MPVCVSACGIVWAVPGGEVGVVSAPWRAEALHALGSIGLNLLLGPGSGVMMVDVVVVDVLGRRPAAATQNALGAAGVGSKEGGDESAGPVWGSRARGVASHPGRLAARGLEDAG